MKIKYITLALGACMMLLLSSCNDFLTIYPTDKTTGEDFWKTKDDVSEMVTGAYSGMTAYDLQARCILWGAYRSDELVKRSSYTSTDLDNISAVNLLPAGSYNNWATFYSVINKCNIVLNHAADVMSEDPEYTQGDYESDRGQMLALRSLCYFYLVRAFRDVPYVTQSYEDDDQVMQVAQTSPDTVLANCITDLQEAEGLVMKSGAYGSNNWRNVGYFTRDAVDALLADIYLWRGSMTHSQSDYELCIQYADKVINSKDQYYREQNGSSISAGNSDIYHLINGMAAMSSIFLTQNSRESILEWQWDGDRNSNTALENYYYEAGSSSSHDQEGMVMATSLFNSVDENASLSNGEKIYQTKDDYRFWNNCYAVNNSEATQLSIRKMVTNTGIIIPTTSNVGETKGNARNFNNYKQNWIVYRLTDVMLMKAEALVQTSDADSTDLQRAFNLVQTVNKRSLVTNSKDTLRFTNYNTKDEMEYLVLAERERELCFEGKRWFDLMRFAYRHMTGVNISQKMADTQSWPSLPKSMIDLMVRKYESGGDAVSYKMKTEPFLYWPIITREVKVNRLLKQNPVYSDAETTSKN
jgi:hypothetical protein